MNAFRVRHLEQALQLYYSPQSTGHLPLDLFLRHYYNCNKSVGSNDKKFITEHIYQIVKWKGLLDHITPPPANWPSRIRTYFVSDRWKLQAQNERLPASVRTSFPAELFRRIEASHGTDKAIHICNILNEEAPVYLRTNTLTITRDRLYHYLLNKGVAVEKSPNSPLALVLPHRQRLGDLPEFHRGYFEIQDEASQLVALKVAVKPGEKVFDYCAGSGGKTLAFGPQMQNKGKIYLHDVREKMLQEAKKRLKRAGITNYTIVPPASPPLSKLAGRIDWVVCDVPCSGTGALRRSPEMKWKYKDEKLMDFIALQRHIFSSALQYVKPKTGKIVYITCSILDEENVHQVCHSSDLGCRADLGASH
ncbi:NOL1/NOP2/sun family domain-containing protein, putative [Eimeria maxima]|uniref:NOL1/NOP2/sun family domain-containing protein, putative n=1 Tax=Eimeria maxima TaxID=5804 RepID=U6M8Y0_EIMMA|nr:NOL1/NOP2/sun family domain-containing protein, putative [Eimeria maxima]CDJ60486.1 NOL1/NOP2/sun family domain-containing protein, putative [Eimeria maxima]